MAREYVPSVAQVQFVRFFIQTLGCKVNLLDSVRLQSALEAAGHHKADAAQEADLIVVNSCTVTSQSDRKSRKAVLSLLSPGANVVVVGCGPRANPNAWIDSANRFEAFHDVSELLSSLGIEEQDSPERFPDKTRIPIAIQTGCDDKCSYCITRLARGPHRSVSETEIIKRVESAVHLGVGEVVLTGINLGAWGAPSTCRPDLSRLPHLIRSLLTTGIRRIRISSLGPQFLSDEFLDVFSDERVCDHLHLSVQSGSARTLRAMARDDSVELLLQRCQAVKTLRPNTAITGDFIVGFPGESEQDHQSTCQFVSAVSFAKLHVFPFSSREGTPAASLPQQISKDIRKTRASELRSLGEILRKRFILSQLGRTVEVLNDGKGGATTSNYLRVTGSRPRGIFESVCLSPQRLLEPSYE